MGYHKHSNFLWESLSIFYLSLFSYINTLDVFQNAHNPTLIYPILAYLFQKGFLKKLIKNMFIKLKFMSFVYN